MTADILIVSPDDHLVEPADLWTSRLPERYREVGPRIVRHRGRMDPSVTSDVAFVDDENGRDADIWHYEDAIIPIPLISAAAGYEIDELTTDPITYDEMRPGCYRAEDRLADMDIAGIEASACFPNTLVRFCGQRFLYGKDKELALLCVQAYNDFQIDEWGAGSDGRLIPLGIIPLWDVDLAAKEVERVAAKGMRAVCFSELPARLDLPSIHSGYWDPFFAACERNQVGIMLHIGSSSSLTKSSPDAPHVVTSALMAVNCTIALVDWLFSAKLKQFPKLKIAFAEAQAGWIPYYLQRVDEVWEDRRAWGGVHPLLTEPPSSQVPGRVWFSTFGDPVAFRILDLVGEDQLMFETDYPHNDTNWPNSTDVANKATEGLDEETKRKVLSTNAKNFFGMS